MRRTFGELLHPASQNKLESWLFFSSVLMVAMGFGYTVSDDSVLFEVIDNLAQLD